jgi:RecB family endonuclease NucS
MVHDCPHTTNPDRSAVGVVGNLEAIEHVKTSTNPSSISASIFIQDGLRRAKAVLVIGSCEISYKGRASSTLRKGERMVMITEDKALLIHRSYGYKPVNWQPAGCKFRIQVDSDDRLEITGVRMKPLESVKIIFDRVYLICLLNLSDKSEILMHGSELEMKNAILYDPSIVEKGFTPIASEKQMPSGFVDVFGKDQDGNYTIIEIKKGKATREAALQLARYVGTLRKQDSQVRGILVAESLAKGTQKSIASLNLEFKRLSPRKCSEVLRKVKRNEEEEISDYF